MGSYALCFAIGIGAWTLLEYVIHGVLSHQHRTVVSSLHQVHHGDPHAVFTSRAWLPVMVIVLAVVGFFGFRPGTFAMLGLVTGFIGYEVLHYRIHFARPRNRFETYLRTRHLAHHAFSPDAIFGVTNSLWDHVLGTEPAPSRQQEMKLAVEKIPALTGPSNWKRAVTIYLGTPRASIR
ncbi:MAG TPA: sterol desaturase family protein [Candidatus Binataceae bacterium]|nr:sterol desaturase family protein [Candidatus Binataceae bacterium]